MHIQTGDLYFVENTLVYEVTIFKTLQSLYESM